MHEKYNFYINILITLLYFRKFFVIALEKKVNILRAHGCIKPVFHPADDPAAFHVNGLRCHL